MNSTTRMIHLSLILIFLGAIVCTADVGPAPTPAKAAYENKKAELAQLNTEAKEQTKQAKAERESLKKKYEKDKSKLTADYKQAKANTPKEDQAKLQEEHKTKLDQLKADYEKARKELGEKAKAQNIQLGNAKAQTKAELAELKSQTKTEQSELKSQTKIEQAETKRRKKLADAEKIEAKREAAEKEKREAKAEANAKAEAKAKAKREERGRKAMAAKLDAEAKKQAKAQAKQAKAEKKAALAQINAEAKELAKQTSSEKTTIKRKFSEDKAQVSAEYKQTKAEAQKQDTTAMDAKHEKALNQLDEKAKANDAELKQAKEKNKADIEELNATAKQQAKQIKAQKAALKQKLDDDKARLKAQHKQAKANAADEDKQRLQEEYKQKLAQLDAEYKNSLKELKEAEQTQKTEIAAAKDNLKTELTEAKAKAKTQAKELKAQKADLKFMYDSTEAVIALYEKQKADLQAEYEKAIAELDAKTDAQNAQIAAKKKQLHAEYQEKIAKINLKLRYLAEELLIEQLALPKDTTPQMAVKELRISGNNLISTAELFNDLPLVYNASDKPLSEAPSSELYDFRVIFDTILQPGESRQVSTRTIQGLTQYILAAYQYQLYAGIYVYVPAQAVIDGKQLQDQLLPIEVIEAAIAELTTKAYDPDQNIKEEGYLRSSAVLEWSPAQVGKVAKQKDLDDFVNLLNLNPDRYATAVVSKGAEPNTLAISYDIYEANPWHWFMQIDNSGTKDREWTPQIGLINTNLLGVDDTFTTIYQATPDSTINDDYSVYGSYDIPIMGPKLRLLLYAGYTEFDISQESGEFNFLGSGTFYGSTLRYNVLQHQGWFFDVRGGWSHEESKVNPLIVQGALATDLKMDFWHIGADVHHSDDISDTSFSFTRSECWGGSDRDEFTLARPGTSPDFIIYYASANHRHYLDLDKIQQISGYFRFIGSNERLAPAKMTTVGGMYTVRGYEEEELVVDGGILASVQYEFDLVRHDQVKENPEEQEQSEQEQETEGQLEFKKFAPVVFIDYGRAKIKDSSVTEKTYEELMSVGVGLIAELGDNLSGVVYYGYPLRATSDTREGKGRVNAGFMARW